MFSLLFPFNSVIHLEQLDIKYDGLSCFFNYSDNEWLKISPGNVDDSVDDDVSNEDNVAVESKLTKAWSIQYLF